ncbi:MAG: hypothetical protein Q4A71_04295 [Actinomycetaceae bacterium]|nr:hypothetical protein [Actinomycetaceae bacterium]
MSNAFGTSSLTQLLPVVAASPLFRAENMDPGVFPLFEVTRIGQYLSVGLALRSRGAVNVLTTQNKLVAHLLDLEKRGYLLDRAWQNFQNLYIAADGTPELRMRLIGEDDARFIRIDNRTPFVSAVLWRFPAKQIGETLNQLGLGGSGIVAVAESDSVAIVPKANAEKPLAEILARYGKMGAECTSTPVPLTLTHGGWIEYLPPVGSTARELTDYITGLLKRRKNEGRVNAAFKIYC